MRNQRGFSFIELIIVIVCGALMLTAFALFGHEHVRRGRKLQEFETALQLARKAMAQQNTTVVTSLTAGTTAIANENGFGDYRIQRYVTDLLTNATTGTRLIQVEIRVAKSDDLATGADGRYLRALARLVTLRHSSATFGDGL